MLVLELNFVSVGVHSDSLLSEEIAAGGTPSVFGGAGLFPKR